MNKTRILSIVSYLTWVGWIAALVLRDPGDGVTRQHLNQALILNLADTVVSILARLPLLGWLSGLLGLATLVFNIWGIWRAIQMSAEPLPVIGQYQIIN